METLARSPSPPPPIHLRAAADAGADEGRGERGGGEGQAWKGARADDASRDAWGRMAVEEGGDARDTEEAAEAEAGAHADAGGANGGGERAVLGAADAGLLVTEAAPLADMLQAILHVYGVDLLGDAGFEGRMSDETAERGGGGCGRGGVRGFEALGRVFAEGVVLCRLASSLQWVTRTKLRCLPRVAASVGAVRKVRRQRPS